MSLMTPARKMAPRLLVPLSVAALVHAAQAGPDWEEMNFGTGDAGRFPTGAQTPFGQPPLSPMETIKGNLVGLSPGPGDFQDMYAIYIIEPAAFSAFANVAVGPGPLNTQLWLFSAGGLGILGNDGVALDSGFTNVSNDGSGAAVTAPGLYYLAISPVPSAPLGITGLPIYFFQTAGEVSGPDGPGGTTAIMDWSTTLGEGEYTIELTGAAFVPCLADVTRDGFVNVEDLVAVILDWGTCSDCQTDINGDDLVNVEDLVQVILKWGTCVPNVPDPV
jgi:hypothetical protein